MKELILYAVLFLCFDSLIAQDTIISIKIELDELELKEKQLKHQLDSILLTSSYNSSFFGHRFIYNMKVTEDSVSNYLIEIFYTRPTYANRSNDSGIFYLNDTTTMFITQNCKNPLFISSGKKDIFTYNEWFYKLGKDEEYLIATFPEEFPTWVLYYDRQKLKLLQRGLNL